MRSRRDRIGLLALAALTAVAAAAPRAAADWLMTVDGQRLEIQGSWEVDGRRVLFTLPNGTLGSLPLDEIDLEASERLTAAAAAPEPVEEAPEEPVTPVMVITDADVARVERPATAADGSDARNAAPPAGDEAATDGDTAGDDTAGEDDTAPAAAASSGPIEVMEWSELLNVESLQLELFGTLRNASSEVASNIELTVRLFDDAESQLAANRAAVNVRTLAPGASTPFRVVFPGVKRFAAATFEIDHTGFKLRGQQRLRADEAESPADAEGGSGSGDGGAR